MPKKCPWCSSPIQRKAEEIHRDWGTGDELPSITHAYRCGAVLLLSPTSEIAGAPNPLNPIAVQEFNTYSNLYVLSVCKKALKKLPL